MKKLIIILALLAGPALVPAQTADTSSANFQRNLQDIVDRTPPIIPQAKVEPLTKFNLDFKGGGPTDLVKAVEKALGKHLNVMIPPDSKADQVVFPPLKLERVDVAQLFKVIGEANRKTARQVTGTGFRPYAAPQPPSYIEYSLEYGFRAAGVAPLTDDTIWYFYNTERDPILETKSPPQITCEHFQMGSYLEFSSIDAITTAIHTSFELLGKKGPQMKFHPDTQLLIVAGLPDQISEVGRLLQKLPLEKPRQGPKAILPQGPPALPSTFPVVAPPTAPLPATPIEPANP